MDTCIWFSDKFYKLNGSVLGVHSSFHMKTQLGLAIRLPDLTAWCSGLHACASGYDSVLDSALGFRNMVSSSGGGKR